MRTSGGILPVLLLALLSFHSMTRAEDDLDDIEFEDDEGMSTSLTEENDAFKNKEEEIQIAVQSALQSPEKRDQLGQVLPIIRSMSPPQKLAMAALVSSRISKKDSEEQPFEEIQKLFSGASRENATRELMLPISMDIAKIISDDAPEELPEAQELRYVSSGKRRRPYYHSSPRRPISLNRRNVHPEGPRPGQTRPIGRPTEVRRGPTDEECTFFSNTICLEAMDYPLEAILRSLRSNKEMVTALLADHISQDSGFTDDKFPTALPLENRFANRFEINDIKERSDMASQFDNVEEGFTCPSQVRYARPQLARAASGAWKYIINTGEHTQTLRLEKCTNPQSSCSFVSENYRSSCTQVYNYHRLLTWDSNLGLHMDIFKVPSCCSCHVHGYSEIFPPHRKNLPSKMKESFPGIEISTENQDGDFNAYNKPSNFISKQSAYPGIEVSSGKRDGLFNEELGPSYFNDVEDQSKYQAFDKKPSFTLPGQSRPKPKPVSRPYENVPHQHAPNTRAPGYLGPILKTKGPRPIRPSRPFRRESSSYLEYPEVRRNHTNSNRYSQEDESARREPSSDNEYQEPLRRVNYNYHPIIDFFKPESSMLQSAQPQLVTQPAPVSGFSDSWQPMIAP